MVTCILLESDASYVCALFSKISYSLFLERCRLRRSDVSVVDSRVFYCIKFAPIGMKISNIEKQAESHRDLRFFRDQRTEKFEQVTIVTELGRQARVDEIVGFGSFIVQFFAFRYNLTETKTSLHQAVDRSRVPLLIHEFRPPSSIEIVS